MGLVVLVQVGVRNAVSRTRSADECPALALGLAAKREGKNYHQH